MADTLKNSMRDYPMLANPALADDPADDQQPLPTIRQQAPPEGQLQLTRQQPAPPAALPKFQRDPFRQQQEQGLQQSLAAKPAPTGFFGKAERILEGIGNAAGTIFLGNNVMSGIPGSAQNNALKQGSAIRQLNDYEDKDRQDEQQFNTTQREQAQEPLLAAQTAKTIADTPTPEQQAASLEHTKAETEAIGRPDLAHAYAAAVQGAMTKGIDPNQDPVVQHIADAITAIQKQPTVSAKEGVQKQLLDAEQKGDKATVQKLQQQLKDMDPMGQQRIGLTIRGQDLASERGGDKADTQTRQASFKAFQPALDSGERFNVMAKNYEDAIKNHDQQAMLSLLANHLGMTMGLQKGARLTKDIIHEAQESRPWLQGLAAKFDKDGVLSGVTLTPEQMRQMVDLGRGRFSEDTVKARNEAHYMGSQDDGPDRTPSRSTMNFYLAQTGGDAPKAKQLAAQDGWTVK